MRPYRPLAIPGSEITPEASYFQRRDILRMAAAGGLALAAPSLAFGTEILAAKPGGYDPQEDVTPETDATSYNNFYEFGTGKADPAEKSGQFNPRPWTIKVDGMVGKPAEFDLDALMAFELEERVYRMRCVEAWSMVIPWIGLPLASLLDQVEPLGSA
jgi:methionine sulfoxide reductase catalytic subunit